MQEISQKRLICAMAALHHAQGNIIEQEDRAGFIEAMLDEVDNQNFADENITGVGLAQNYMSIEPNNNIKVRLGSWLVANSRDCITWEVLCNALWLFRSKENCSDNLREEFLERYPDAFNKDIWKEHYISHVNNIEQFLFILSLDEINKNKYSQHCYDNLYDAFTISIVDVDEHIKYFNDEMIMRKVTGAEKVVEIKTKIIFGKHTEVEVEDGIYKLFLDKYLEIYKGFIEVRNKKIVSAQDLRTEDIGINLIGVKLKEDADVPVDYGFFNKGRNNYLGGGNNWIANLK